MSSQQETASYGGYGRDRSALAGLGEALLDALDTHSTDTQWGQWLQAPFEVAAIAGDVPLATALFKAGVAGDHLHPAIRADQGQLVKELLRLGASPTAKDKQGDAPIHVAASLGHGNIIKALLLKKDAVVHEEQEDGRGRTPLHLACWRGHAAAVEALLDMYSSREDVRRRLGKTGVGFTAFDIAVRGNHVGVKKALLARWPDEKATRTSLKLADGAILLEASEQNNVPMIDFLVVEAGTDVNFKNDRGFTPLHSAALKGASQAIGALMEHGADVSAVDEEGQTPVHLAAKGGHAAAIDLLCAVGVDPNLRVKQSFSYAPEYDTWSALDFAAIEGNVDAAKALVRQGADWEAVSPEGLTVLNTAAAGNKPEVIDLLIELGASADGEHGVTQLPIYSAISGNSPDAVRALLRHGADLHAKGVIHDTPLQDAMQWDTCDVINVLLEHGADPNGIGVDGMTLLQMVFDLSLSVDVLRTLVQGGADISLPLDEGEYPLHQAARRFTGPTAIELLIEAGADVHAESSAGLTPLQIACSRNDGHAVAALLRHGASMDVVDEAGLTLLQLACSGSDGYAVATLLRHGASMDVVDQEGNSVLHLAAMAEARLGLRYRWTMGSHPPSSVDVLLRAGADETAVNDENHTPRDRVRLELSRRRRYRETARPVLELLARAPHDRAWRRRALWVMRRAHPNRTRLGMEESRAKLARVDAGAGAASDAGGEEPGDALDGDGGEHFRRLVVKVLGLHEEGIFRHVVGFL